MSAAKKCDRCGKFYEKNNTHKGIAWNTNGTISGIRTITTDDYTDYKYDLCDECLDKLYKFLNNESTDEVEQGTGRSSDYKSCDDCKYKDVEISLPPCKGCAVDGEYWEPKDENVEDTKKNTDCIINNWSSKDIPEFSLRASDYINQEDNNE